MTPTDLRTIRTALGITQAQLAEMCDVDVRTVKRWEAGASPVPRLVAMMLERLAAA